MIAEAYAAQYGGAEYLPCHLQIDRQAWTSVLKTPHRKSGASSQRYPLARWRFSPSMSPKAPGPPSRAARAKAYVAGYLLASMAISRLRTASCFAAHRQITIKASSSCPSFPMAGGASSCNTIVVMATRGSDSSKKQTFGWVSLR